MASLSSTLTPSNSRANSITSNLGVKRSAASSWPTTISTSSWPTTISTSPSLTFRFPVCMSKPVSSPATATPLIRDNNSLLEYLRQPMYVPPEVDESTRMMELVEGTRQALQRASDPVLAMKLVDTLQRLGIGYHFEQDINALLERFSEGQPGDNLFTVALRFRLLRYNGHQISEDVFEKFMENGMFRISLSEDTLGLLSLYEASYLGANGEELLSHAMEFTERQLKQSIPAMTPQLSRQVLQALELPRHLRMERLEARRYIEEYGRESNHSLALLELAKLDCNKVQLLHQTELAEVSRWWKHLGLVDKLRFARNRPLECFLWTVGILPEPKYSGCRIQLAKTIAILLVIDDVFDTYGSFDELVLFTDSIQRWNLIAMDQLPEYMKICYMALYNTTNEICYEVLKEHGYSVLPYLKNTWIDMIEGFMLEAKWVNSGNVPKLEEYIENGVTTAGSYMALVHIFFLIGQGVTEESVKSLVKPYPRFFSCSGRILRLWDDLGTFKEEQERGDVASSIQLLIRENNIQSEDEGRKQVEQLIKSLWKELNGEFIAPKALPLPIIKAAFNMARTSQVVYRHNEATYFSSVDNYAQSLFFTHIDL